ncbi:MAG: DNA-processing protein DprA, partial [Pseudomonadales bacterium]|nr:DNA-processing protein DprA [Pseudomonadales bacterium]
MFDRDDWLRLAIAPQRWRARVRALCRDGAAADQVDALRARLRETVPARALGQLRTRCEQAGVSTVTPVDAAWPPRLGEIPDPPAALFLRGRAALLQAPQIAVVGARRASPRGLSDAVWITGELVRAGICVTSGLALGIDGAAHRAALAANGDTIAVLGAGIDRVYPARHRPLADRIMEAGLLVTEFAPGVPAARHHFPQRNRIISGLCLGVVIVEAGEHSGSLITARLAAEQGREVFVLPTTARDPGGAGGHRLIREGATLIRGLDDLLEELLLPPGA